MTDITRRDRQEKNTTQFRHQAQRGGKCVEEEEEEERGAGEIFQHKKIGVEPVPRT